MYMYDVVCMYVVVYMMMYAYNVLLSSRFSSILVFIHVFMYLCIERGERGGNEEGERGEREAGIRAELGWAGRSKSEIRDIYRIVKRIDR